MKITESYLRSLIRQTLKEISSGDIPNQHFASEDFEEMPVEQGILTSLKAQGYKIKELGNGRYEVVDPKNPFNSGILEPTLKRK